MLRNRNKTGAIFKTHPSCLSSTFFCIKCHVEREHYSKKICLKNAVQEQKVTDDTWKKLFIEKIVLSHKSVDTLTDSANVDFGCASSSSQSKKDNFIEVQ